VSVMTCNLCKKEGKLTLIPHDEIGVELMHQHLHDEHGIEKP
jgi:hypothetical protein